jgi:hypothetical protein
LTPLTIKEWNSGKLVGLNLIGGSHLFRFWFWRGCWGRCVTWRIAWIVSLIFFHVVCVSCSWDNLGFWLFFFGGVWFGLFVDVVVVVIVVGRFFTVSCLVFLFFHEP